MADTIAGEKDFVVACESVKKLGETLDMLLRFEGEFLHSKRKTLAEMTGDTAQEFSLITTRLKYIETSIEIVLSKIEVTLQKAA